MKENLNHLEPNARKHPIFKIKGIGLNGCFLFDSPINKKVKLHVISSDGMGWDHVSVSTNRNRCPNWQELCFIKEKFFKDSETVIQFHPKKSEYVNNKQNCLHLWRSQSEEHVLPVSILVGVK